MIDLNSFFFIYLLQIHVFCTWLCLMVITTSSRSALDSRGTGYLSAASEVAWKLVTISVYDSITLDSNM